MLFLFLTNKIFIMGKNKSSVNSVENYATFICYSYQKFSFLEDESPLIILNENAF